MNRILKFRAWHDGAKQMLLEDNPGNIFRWKNEGQPVEIMQYTGLKDSKGVEIYEGDVLRSSNWACDCEVRWKDGGFVNMQGETCYTLGADIARHLENYEMDIAVIGNIYDNPELLGGK